MSPPDEWIDGDGPREPRKGDRLIGLWPDEICTLAAKAAIAEVVARLPRLLDDAIAKAFAHDDGREVLRRAAERAIVDALPALRPAISAAAAHAVDDQLRPKGIRDASQPMISFNEARQLLRTSHQTIARALRSGAVPATFDERARRWHIDREALIAWDRKRWAR